MLPTLRDWPKIAALAGIYVVAAEIGLELSVAFSNVTPVWAPTGISLAALLLFGYRLWPGVFLGAFIANGLTDIPLWTSGVIAVGNTAEALIGAYLMRRFGFDEKLERAGDVLILVLFAAVSCAVAATVGTTALALADEIPMSSYGFAWQLWLFGDTMGDLLVAPFILTWARTRSPDRERRSPLEGIVLVGTLIATGYLVFIGGRWRYPYLLFPLFVWAALRFRQRGATTATLIMSTFAVIGTLNGAVPFEGITPTASVEILQGLMGILAVTTLLLAATITERERSQGDLAHSVSMLNATLDSTRDGILVVDSRGAITGYNQRFADMWKIPREIVDRRDDDAAVAFVLDQLEDPEGFRSRIADVYAHPEDESFDELRFKDGKLFERSSRPQKVGDEVVGRVWSFSDVTERRRLEVARAHFINDAAHELRTPVATLEGMASVLVEDLADVENKDLAQAAGVVERQSRRISGLITRMLDLGRVEGRALELGPVDVRHVIDVVIATTPPPDGKTVSVSCAEGVVALAEEGSVDQIITNLLTNAYRYGGDSIEIGCERDVRVVVTVTDDGPGIDPNLVPTLFDPFVRGSSKADGYGLGLAIVQSLARAVHGEISYQPREPTGSVFRLSLPVPDSD